MFELYYSKHRNSKLFDYLEKEDDYENMQNYIPIYDMFFQMNDTNWNNVNLNNDIYLDSIVSKKNDTNYDIHVKKETSDTIQKVSTYIKLAPLLDPIKFMVGKYTSIPKERLMTLPKYGKTQTELLEQSNHQVLKHINSPHNSSYVDAFFSYLTSKTLHSHDFVHGLQFYGSYIGIKKNLVINVADDLDYLQDSDHFLGNQNTDYIIDHEVYHELMNCETRKNKEELDIKSVTSKYSINSISDIHELSELFKESTEKNGSSDKIILTLDDIDGGDIIYETELPIKTKQSQGTNTSSSSCSSRVSNVSHDSHGLHIESSVYSDDMNSVYSDNKDDGDNDEESSYESEEESDDEDSIIANVTMKQFPVNLIFLEKMESTLDNYMMNNEIPQKEWKSILFQIVVQLYTYQRMFDFTHNDLHTNNIMYNSTDKKHIIYHVDGKYFKVPTYGKIYKIIDFGRAIYKFKGKRYCSDSYAPHGDAHTQYNCEPFYNPKKKTIEPNYAFDLCRLGCSLYDYFEDDIEMNTVNEKRNIVAELIREWCCDDSGNNVLYKKNGRDRYPGFKLYKMIARTVTKHTPKAILEHIIFDVFKTTRKQLNRRSKIVNVNKYPSYV